MAPSLSCYQLLLRKLYKIYPHIPEFPIVWGSVTFPDYTEWSSRPRAAVTLLFKVLKGSWGVPGCWGAAVFCGTITGDEKWKPREDEVASWERAGKLPGVGNTVGAVQLALVLSGPADASTHQRAEQLALWVSGGVWGALGELEPDQKPPRRLCRPHVSSRELMQISL